MQPAWAARTKHGEGFAAEISNSGNVFCDLEEWLLFTNIQFSCRTSWSSDTRLMKSESLSDGFREASLLSRHTSTRIHHDSAASPEVRHSGQRRLGLHSLELDGWRARTS